MVSARDVAALLVEKLGNTFTLKLHRLLYFCQGFHLAWDGVPLFEEPIEAWASGPVVRPIMNQHLGQFLLESPWPEDGDPGRLIPEEKESVEAVLTMFGDWTLSQLTMVTCRERPWIEARDGLPPGAPGNTEINLEVMQDYFTGKVFADDDAEESEG